MGKLVSVASLAAAVAAATFVAAPAAAADAVHIEADTPFAEGVPGTFTSSLQDCGTGIVENGSASLAGSARFGIFNGFKHFTCEGGSGGFVIRLQAKFDDTGSRGTWAIVGSWGTQAGLHGSGTLAGEPQTGGILDVYDGTLRP